MKKLMIIIKIVCLSIAFSIWSLGLSLAADIAVGTGLSYQWWDSDGDHDGSQIAIPVEGNMVMDDFSCRLLTGFSSTQSDSSGSDGSLSSLLDTKLNFSYQWLDRWAVDILVGFDVNLPTGKTDLDEDEIAMIVDPEMISISPFGEGFNLNPTLVLAKSWGDIAGGVGLGYAWRGEYDFSADRREYDPGDILTLTGELRYQLTVDWKLKGYFEYATFSEDKDSLGAFHENGDLIVVGVGADGQKGDLTLFVDFHTVLKNKPKMQVGDTRILIESDKNNGDELSLSAGFEYPWGKEASFTGMASILLVEENDFPESSLLYIGDKEKIDLKIGVTRTLRANLEGIANLGFMYMNSKKDWWFQPAEEDLTVKGFTVFVGVNSTF